MIENIRDQDAERLDPWRYVFGGSGGYLGNAAHIQRYRFAVEHLPSGGVVLDAACGTGYGSCELARISKRVVGLDAAAEAVRYAQENYAAVNCEYRQADVCDLSFQADGSVDAVVSFETIEHLAEPGRFLAETARVLRPEGMLVVSTPYQPRTIRRPRNPFHVVEFGVREFAAMLHEHFLGVGIFLECVVESKVKWCLKTVDVLGIRQLIRRLGRPADRVILDTPTVTEVDLQQLKRALAAIVIKERPMSTRYLATVALCQGKR